MCGCCRWQELIGFNRRSRLANDPDQRRRLQKILFLQLTPLHGRRASPKEARSNPVSRCGRLLALMGIDEAGTPARLRAMRRDLIDPLIAAHSGRTVKLMG